MFFSLVDLKGAATAAGGVPPFFKINLGGGKLSTPRQARGISLILKLLLITADIACLTAGRPSTSFINNQFNYQLGAGQAPCLSRKILVDRERVELSTPCLQSRCSDQLS